MTPHRDAAARPPGTRTLTAIAAGAVAAFVIAISSSMVAAQQQSRCADCHFANPDAPASRHVSDWDNSPHGRGQVSCERCHDGNPSTFESMQAHRGILAPTNARSPVNRANLPQTCGACHAGPYSQFQKSRHFELLKTGNRNGPTCSTCHGEVAGELPSPKAIEGQCQRCHGERSAQPRPGRAANARTMIQGIRDVRAQLRDADAAIGRIKDQARRTRLRADADQVRVPLVQAADAGHAFVYDGLQERLQTARTRLVALQEQVANPAPAR
jgi:Cytochrome c554 and c-prime